MGGSRTRNAFPGRLIALCVGVAVLVTGCSGGDDTAGAPETPESDPDTAPDAGTDTEAGAGMESVDVYFTNLDRGDTGEVFPVPREVSGDDLPFAALGELLSGPTDAEEADGYSSWFSDETSDALRSLDIEDGVASVDFEADLPDIIPNASTSAGSTALLAELDTTLEQFPEVSSILYSLDGDRTAFYEWLQLGVPDGQAAPTDGDQPESGDAVSEPVVVEVYFGHEQRGTDTDVFAVERRVAPPAVLEAALGELLAGPTAEERRDGYESWFSEDTAGLLNSVVLDQGVAHVDLNGSIVDVIPGASTSSGSTALLAALDATSTQFPTVAEVIYALDGDVAAFYEWLQRSAPD